jgi:hypothetical protein
MWNERAEYMKSVGKIAVNALTTMVILWEQMEFETEKPIEEFIENYPFDKSFDEIVFAFSEWVNYWHDQI